ncbi:MAG TPA: lipoyl synthase [Candidatus Eremiobacteraeota bacterium]|nr:lipoyl synthase [Candidatus Eremiobacteraeota bacterium]
MKLLKPKPPWLRTRLPSGENYRKLISILKEMHLHTVCEEARCPNIGECFSCGKATFMILGNICTRNCRFCAVSHGVPEQVDPCEPENVALTISKLNLKYAVITSVTRDDLCDGGAEHFAKTIRAIKKISPETKIETLIPDFQGNEDALRLVLSSEVNVLNHNIETVPELYHSVRPEAIYERSIDLIRKAAGISRDIVIKSGIMAGLGETKVQIMAVIKDLIKAGCHILTIGQYLSPSKEHLPVHRYLTPEEFEVFREEGERLGMKKIISGPLIRSSYFRSDIL